MVSEGEADARRLWDGLVFHHFRNRLGLYSRDQADGFLVQCHVLPEHIDSEQYPEKKFRAAFEASDSAIRARIIHELWNRLEAFLGEDSPWLVQQRGWVEGMYRKYAQPAEADGGHMDGTWPDVQDKLNKAVECLRGGDPVHAALLANGAARGYFKKILVSKSSRVPKSLEERFEKICKLRSHSGEWEPEYIHMEASFRETLSASKVIRDEGSDAHEIEPEHHRRRTTRSPDALAAANARATLATIRYVHDLDLAGALDS